jgi:hypothetical protein
MYDAVATEPEQVADGIRAELARFLQPLLVELDAQIDARLVRTFLRTVDAILCFRNRPHGLLLSELGGYLLDPTHAAAGTKRLSNLLRSGKWTSTLTEDFLWNGATRELERLKEEGKTALVLWDESVLEKPESIANPDLGAVRSSKAHRLNRLKPGYYRPPAAPTFVPGFQWIGLLLAGMTGPGRVAAFQWWTTRGERRSDKRTEETTLLQRAITAWGQRACHVFDRGFASRPWITLLIETKARFIVRWPARHKLCDIAEHPHPAWELVRGKRAWDHRELWDARAHCYRKTGILAVPVLYDGHSLVLIVARRGRGQQPWYLLTNEPVADPQELWRIVLAYARRWQLEMVWRYAKSELGMESVRVWTWERRKKLLLLAALAYAFLVSLLDPVHDLLRAWLLTHWCKRTGKRSRETPTPLYRLRSALSRLLVAYPSHPPGHQSSG